MNSTIFDKKFVILDGAMGTMLINRGMKLGSIPEELSIDNPDMIIDIHKQYVNAGSDVIYANTFGANRYKLSKSKYSVKEVISAAIANAKKACEGTDTKVALDLGPIGKMMEPIGDMKFEEAYDIYKEQVLAGSAADLIVLETQTDLYEVKAAVLACKENSNLPIMVTMTFEENQRTFTGCTIESMAVTLSALCVDAIGINCSLGPKELYSLVEKLRKWTTLPIVVKPNAGLPDPVTNNYNTTPEEFAEEMKKMISLGVKVFGGCCGTNPDYVKALKTMLADKKPFENEVSIPSCVCTPAKMVCIDRPRVIGERINPTGKKLFKEALQKHDINYILNRAIEQAEAGADILDVNVGLPGIDEEQMMIDVVKSIQSVVDLPLQIDSTIPKVIEAGLRIYNGKAIVNSVNGEDEVLDNILPIVKKYGAAVVGLTLDKDGIPKTAEKRFEIANKILHKALEYGIPKEDVYIDCLTLTASAEQEGVMNTLEALNRVKKELGLKTVLGVSNISFGLPNRELVNQNFLTMALAYGLDLPIINPNVAAMMGAVRTYKVLANIDKSAVEYIEAYANAEKTEKPVMAADITLEYAIAKGLKDEAGRITVKMLETMEPMDIINEHLIKALDEAGTKFEQGKIFLPQLISSAGAATKAFDEIKKNMASGGETSKSNGTIVIATVKGDVHDIGKNIVKVLLENYGYDVIDLGKDVDYQAVVDAVKKYDAKLVGLSALMTTTLVSMENTIKLIKENNLDCKIMVGGAVLTPDYALEIGADYYSKDAKEAVDIAKKVLTKI
ncbi:MAG: homocysteine methyltransferase [Lachnospira sp.]|nr:homocysteine methyltransferase [Lachnospira sp.]